jgi:hypothetical protein
MGQCSRGPAARAIFGHYTPKRLESVAQFHLRAAGIASEIKRLPTITKSFERLSAGA